MKQPPPSDDYVFMRYYQTCMACLAPLYQNNPALVDVAAHYAVSMLKNHHAIIAIEPPREFSEGSSAIDVPPTEDGR